MATIPATSMTGAGARVISKITLGASDTFVYNASRNPELFLLNSSGGALTPKIDGAGGTTVPVAGVGNVSVADGYTTPSIADGALVSIPLKSIEKYLQGTIAVTGGTGIVAWITEH